MMSILSPPALVKVCEGTAEDHHLFIRLYIDKLVFIYCLAKPVAAVGEQKEITPAKPSCT